MTNINPIDVIVKCQEVLAKYIVPDSGISDSECINQLLEILDNQELVKFIRMTNEKTAKQSHAEAFCLMVYRCEKCGIEETLWNSRDGVTPFMINCRVCGGMMQHIKWNQDKRDPDFFPPKGMRVFVDLYPQIENVRWRYHVLRHWDSSSYPLKRHYKTMKEALDSFLNDEGKGCTQPDIITVGE